MKKKILFSILAVILCLPFMFAITGCSSSFSLMLDISDAKTTYYVGEEFSSEGLIVVAKRNDGTTEEVTDFEIDSTQFNKDKAGVYLIYVSKSNVSKAYAVSVVEDVVESLSIVSQNKYFVGQDFKSGAKVVANYASGKTEQISNYEISEFDSNTAGTKNVEISFAGKTISAEAEVLSNEDFMLYAQNNFKSHVVSSSNCDPSDLDPTQLSSAIFDYEMKNASIHSNFSVVSANNGEMLYFIPEGDKYFWVDLQTNTLYMLSSDYLTAQTKTFDDLRSIVLFLTEDEQAVGSYGMQLFVDMEATCLLMMDTPWQVNSVSLTDGTIILIGEGCWAKLDYQTWKPIEFCPTPSMLVKFDQGDVVPTLPDMNWQSID